MSQEQKIKAIIFDVGQTILSPDYPFFKTMLAEYGVQTDIDKLAKGAALGREKFFRGEDEDRWKEYFTFWLSYVGAAEKDFPEMLQRIYERHKREHLWKWIEPTAEQTFVELQKMNVRLAIVSNADGMVEKLFKSMQLDHFFEVIVDSQIVGVEKPDPKIFEIALDRLDLPSQSCIYVGDNYDKDIVGARRAGLQPILIDPYDVVPENDVTKIKVLAELPQMLSESNQQGYHGGVKKFQ